MNYIEIAVDVPVGPNRTFTYNNPENIHATAGQMVRVPFTNRTVLGIVFEASTGQTPDPIVGQIVRGPILNILEVVSEEVFFTDSQLVLARWVSQYYYASLYQVASAMLPSGMIPKSNTTLAVNHTQLIHYSSSDTLSDESLKVLDYVNTHGDITERKLIREFGSASRSVIDDLRSNQYLTVHESVLPPRVGPKMQDFISISNELHLYRVFLHHFLVEQDFSF